MGRYMVDWFIEQIHTVGKISAMSVLGLCCMSNLLLKYLSEYSSTRLEYLMFSVN